MEQNKRQEDGAVRDLPQEWSRTKDKKMEQLGTYLKNEAEQKTKIWNS
jgi:hypothetical protein